MEFKVVKMKFNYNGLWKILIDKNMKKKDLTELTKISPTTTAKMTKGEPVSLSIIGRIASVLNVNIGDIVSLDYSHSEEL
jgi:putative transcriptional regulator